MNRPALTIAAWWSRADRHLFTLMGAVCSLAACSSRQASPEADVPGGDEAWVASACQPVSVDTSGWRRYRLGDITIQLPVHYTPVRSIESLNVRATGYAGYDFAARGPGGIVWLYLHRNARYTFDQYNIARRGQNWCNGSLGGYQAEILSWFEPFDGARRSAGEFLFQNTYNFAARLPASWRGQDEGKWLFLYVGASRLRDARLLRDALHTLTAVRASR